ncbi:MAG: Antitoxin [Campylobacterota bacterium]|nr:Antitoxin [Campylobacterota bacterium]
MHYKNKEFVSTKDLQNDLDKHLDYISQDPFNRLVIVRDGKKEAVMIPISEYEHIKSVADYMEMQEIAQIVQERINTKEKVSHEEIIKKRAKEEQAELERWERGAELASKDKEYQKLFKD